MNGNVFECHEEQTDRRQYAKTLEALQGYVKKNLKFADDLAPLFATTMANPVIVRPTNEGVPGDPTDDMIFKEEIKEYVNRLRGMKDNMATIQAVVWGQCSESMKSKVKSIDGYEDRATANDCFWLLKQIKAVTLQFDQKRNGFLSIMDTRTSFLNCKQGQNQNIDEYFEDIKGFSDTIEYHGGSVAESHTLVPENDEHGVALSEAQRKTIARDKTLAAALMRGADPTRYGALLADLSNAYAQGRDEYPADINAAYSLLANYRNPVNARARNSGPNPHTPSTISETPAMTFAQRGTVAGNNGMMHDGITCYTCNNVGHYAANCPDDHQVNGTTHQGTTLTQYAYMLTQANGHELDPNWILLDSQSTISVFRNASMLTNIRKSPHVLRALTNGGHQDSNMVGDFANLGEVWYNSNSIANILSLSDVRKVCRVTMDTGEEASMCVHRTDGSEMKFLEHPCGLYIFDSNKPTSNKSVNAYTMVSTVAEQRKMFSKRQIAAADAARDLYRKIGRPDEAEFIALLRNNSIRNCPVTADDARRALTIYGTDIAVLKGKTTKTDMSPRVPTFEAVTLPTYVIEHHRNITLCVDFFFVQGHCFLHTISRNIGFRTVSPVVDRKVQTILREIRAVINLYESRGLIIRDIHGDNEFECLREAVRPIDVNIVPADSHVGEVERSIRTIKERIRSCVHGLPFKRLPKLMITQLVSYAIRCLNQFPWKNGISDTLSPASIVTGLPNPDFRHMALEFGAYVQVFEDNDPSNTIRARSLGAIALNPTGNAQGDYFFMSLASGAKISRHQWHELPLTDLAIARVEALGKLEHQPLIQERGLVVETRPDQPFDPDEYDRDYHNLDNPDEIFVDADFDPIDPDELHDLAVDAPGPLPIDGPFPAPPVLDQGAFIADPAANNEHDNAPEAADEEDEEQQELFEDEQDPFANDNANNEDEDANDEAPHHVGNEGAPQDAPQGAYNLRDRGAANRNVRFNDAMDNPHDGKSYYPPARQLIQHGIMLEADRHHVFAHVMTQMSAKAGLRKHGKAAEAALMAEFSQLEDLSVYQSIDASSLTTKQRKNALRAINLIKEKRCGKLKGRTVADGRPQKDLYDKSETASPTVSTDALMLTIITEAHEARDVATADVAGAYLKADMVDFVVMKFTGESVDILCSLNDEHTKFVVTEGTTKALYVRLDKAIYGCVKSALLWYDLFSSHLKEMGFVLNPYDPCIANCTIEGSQCTVSWYVDDNKISHVNPNVVTMIIDKIEEKFDKMTVTRGNEHVFLGMHIKYDKSARTANIKMKDYLQEAIEESGLDIQRVATTPARKSLFEVNEGAKLLDTSEAMAFHRVVAKLLYVSIRARMDLLLAISFLTTRVSKSTTEDRAKLKRVLEYIKGTMELTYTLGADKLGRLRTWVDASYAVHPDMKSHTGGVMSFGVGGLVCKSSKQKLNTKSSTEAEVVGASDYLPNTLWVKMFMEAQGHDIVENYFEQDNESAIKMEKNGRSSAGPRSRHIDIRYFWIKDRVKSAGVKIRHCPTLQMLGDFFTKPLQGNLFRIFRDVILGYHHIDTLLDATSKVEERVGNQRPKDEPAKIPGTERAKEMTKVRSKVETKRGAVTWADIVRGTTSTNQENESNRNKIVLRSLSQNNPVSKGGV